MTSDAHSPLTPYLSVRDADAAIAFYEAAFGARRRPPTLRFRDGKIAHAEVEIAGARLMLSEEAPETGGPGPETLRGTTVRLDLRVDDADAVVERAVAAGAEVAIPVADQFYGHRSGRLRDPFGHLWIISQALEELSEAEMQRRMDAMMKEN